MGACTSTQSTYNYPLYTSHPDYTSAGILFAEGPVALAGVQKHRLLGHDDIATLSGFGGRKEPKDFDWCHTAWREVIEELYGESVIPVELILDLRRLIPVKEPEVERHNYVLFRLTFADLTQVLRICALPKYKLASPIYSSLPLTLEDLILKRQPKSHTEVGTLSLVPISHDVSVDTYFTEDLAALRN